MLLVKQLFQTILEEQQFLNGMREFSKLYVSSFGGSAFVAGDTISGTTSNASGTLLQVV